MNEDDQKIAITKASDWKPNPFIRDMSGQVRPQSPPDYLKDLNAMQSAENTLSVRDKQGYISILRNICTVAGCWPETATAAQRAEAFLRVINKWVE